MADAGMAAQAATDAAQAAAKAAEAALKAAQAAAGEATNEPWWALGVFVMFVACVLTSHWLSRQKWPAVLALLAVQATVLMFTLGLLWGVLTSPSRLTDLWVALEAAVGLIVLVLAMRHCHYLGTCLARTPAPTETQEALPSQQRLIEKLTELASNVDEIDTRSQLVSLRGEWGSGKTTLVRLLCKRFQDRPAWKRFQDPTKPPLWLQVWHRIRPLQTDQGAVAPRERREPIVVFFNAWRHQSDPSLEVSLYGEIANTVLTELRDLWWLRPVFYPLFLSAAQRLSFNLPSLGQSAAVDVRMRPPGVELFPHLRRLAAAVESRKGRIVLVLDEIDRCEPLAAQAMLTLSQRFLQMQGILTIIPFVMSQLQFKVFHPSVAGLPEIRASSAQIFEENAGFQSLLKEEPDSISWFHSMTSQQYSPNITDPRISLFPFGRELHPLMQGMMIKAFYENVSIKMFFSEIEERFIKTRFYLLEEIGPDDFAFLILSHRGVSSDCIALALALGLTTDPQLHQLVRWQVKSAFGVDPDAGWKPAVATGPASAKDSYFWTLCADIWIQSSHGGRGRNGKPIPLRGLIASLTLVLAEFGNEVGKRQWVGVMTESQRSALYLQLLAQALHVSVARLV